MVILDSSIVNIKSQHKDLEMLAVEGDQIIGICEDEPYIAQVTGGFSFRRLTDEDRPLYERVLEAKRQIKDGKKLVTAEQLIVQRLNYSKWNMSSREVPDYEVTETKLTGWKWLSAKLKKQETVVHEKRKVGSHMEFSWTHETAITYKIVWRNDMDVIDQYLKVNFNVFATIAYPKKAEEQRVMLAKAILADENCCKYFTSRAKEESSPEILYTKGELWQSTIVRAFLSQLEPADKLTKMLKAELEWPGEAKDRSGAYIHIGSDTLEDLITKYARK